MLVDVLPVNPLRWTLLEAEHLLRRGIVEQSLTLGFAPLVMDGQPPEAEEPAPEPEPAPRSRRATTAAAVDIVPEPATEPVRRRRKTTPIESLPVGEVAEPKAPAKRRTKKRAVKAPASV